jgi:hypothetical protein
MYARTNEVLEPITSVLAYPTVFILNEILAHDKIYVLVGTLLGWNVLLIMAANYK